MEKMSCRLATEMLQRGKRHCCTFFKNINMYKIMHINFTTRVVSHKFVSAAVIALGVNKRAMSDFGVRANMPRRHERDVKKDSKVDSL